MEALLRERFNWLPKDYIETAEGLRFAVVAEGTEQDRVVATLRYAKRPHGWEKLSTSAAQQILAWHSNYRYYSLSRDIELPGIPANQIVQHYRPKDGWLHAIEQSTDFREKPTNPKFANQFCTIAEVLNPIADDLGLTGSHLLGLAHEGSDIDLVIYGHENFQRARNCIAEALSAQRISPLRNLEWQTAYERRGCELDLESYVWHEARKLNKFMIDGTKIDISCCDLPHPAALASGRKIEHLTIQAKVVEDQGAYLAPAVYQVDHSRVHWVVCQTPTYTGQAYLGEWIEAAGWLEELSTGEGRLLVGSSREAGGEYLRVLTPPA